MAQKSKHAIPEGFHSLTLSLWFNGNCKEAIEYYQKVFKAKVFGDIIKDDDTNTIMHAVLSFGDSKIMLGDCFPGGIEKGPSEFCTAGIYFYTENPDEIFDLAVKNGAQVLMPMMDAFWGDRFGKVVDPFGHTWALSRKDYDFTKEEEEKRQEEFFKKMSSCHEGCC